MARLRKWGLVALLALSLVACTKEEPPELVQAADAIGDLLKPINLFRSMFAVAFPDGSSSRYVSYLFSDMGAAEWPPTEEWADEMTREQMASVGLTLLPADVAILPLTPDPEKGKQLVISFEDARGVVIARGYLDATEEPSLTREWKLPTVEPAPGIEFIYESNLELGMSAQSFPAP